MKTTDRQPNETEARIMPHKDEYRNCFVCKQPITEGQSYYCLSNQVFQKRHTTCARNVTGTLPEGMIKKGGSYHGTGGRVIRGTNSM